MKPRTNPAAREWQTRHSVRAGKRPDLLTLAARLARVGHDELLGVAARGDQLGVGLLGIPAVRVADPFPLLAGEQTRLDPLAG